MAVTSNTYTGNGSNKLFSITFPYIDLTDVDVYLNGVLQTITTQYSFANATTIEFVTAPANGATVRLDRSTDDSDNPATFFPGSSIKANDLNANFDQTLYVVQEINNKAVDKTGDTMSGNLDMGGNRITTLGTPTTDTDAANKQYIDSRLGEIGIPGHTRWSKTATAGQTVLSGVGSEGNTLEYSASREQVFVNGALLQRNVDYTANDGLIITMLAPLILGDVVDVRCVNNLPEGIDGLASDITFLQAGTGAVSRSVDSKLKDLIDRDDFVDDSSFNTASAGKVAINGTNTVLAPRFEGNTTTDSGTPDAVFRVSRTHTGAASPHSFRDQTVFNPSSPGVAAASFDAALTSSGSQNQDHTIGFQVRNAHDGSGTLTNLQGFGSYLVANGPVTNSHGLEVISVSGGGTVTNEYGVIIRNLTKGTNKYPIFVANNLGTNSIGAATNFNNSGVVSVGGTVKLFLGDSGSGYKSIAYNHNQNSNTYDYGDQIQSIYFGPQDITFRCAPVGTAGATPTLTNILSIRTDSTNPSYLAVFPTTDNVSNLGLGGFRWKEIFCANGTINTSDARVKTEVRQLSDPEIAAAKDLAREIGAYKFLTAVAEKGDSARDHVGMTVQRAIEVMEQHGLDPVAYGFICHDQWGDEYEDVSAVPSWVEDPETGELVQGPDKEPAHRKLIKEAGDLYSFRTEQLLLFIARGFEARLSALEAT